MNAMPSPETAARREAENGAAVRPGRKGLLRRTGRALVRGVGLALLLVLLFPAACVVGLAPIHRHRGPIDEGVELFVRASEIHTQLVFPVEHAPAEWHRLFPPEDFNLKRPRAYIGFGWGDRRFLTTTPTWDTMRRTTAARAIAWPTSAAMHVEYLDRPAEGPYCRRMLVTPEEFAVLAEHVMQSLKFDEQGRPVPIDGHVWPAGHALYGARGGYWLMNTCNHWTQQGLKSAGIRTGLWTPMPHGVMWNLPAAPAGPTENAAAPKTTSLP